LVVELENSCFEWLATFESLAQGFLNEDPDRVHQVAGDRHSNIQPEQTQQELQQLQQELRSICAYCKALGGAQDATCEKCCACALSV